MLPRFRLLAAALAALALPACTHSPRSPMASSPPLRTVSHVDLPRYMGDWRVIANIPYFAERGNVDSVETYQLRPDGTIDNRFAFRKHSFDAPLKSMAFTAEVKNPQTNAEWRVRFLPFFKVAYLILDLDPAYQWVAVGHPSRKYGWIMARAKTLPEETYQGILQRLRAQGYDPAKFAKVPQTRAQLGGGAP